MRKNQKRDLNKPWGSYTEDEATNYHAKLGLKCCDCKTYQRWFKLAERGNFACRTLTAFCNDCTPDFQAEMTQQGRCIKNTSSTGDTLPESR